MIATKIEGGLSLKPLPSLIVDSSFLEKYIGTKGESSRVEMYVCDEKKKCLDPKVVVTTLTVKDTFSRLKKSNFILQEISMEVYMHYISIHFKKFLSQKNFHLKKIILKNIMLL